AALQHVHDAADDPPVIDPLLAPNVGRQMRLDPRRLLIAQPKQVAAHLPCSLSARNHQTILRSTTLLGFDPSLVLLHHQHTTEAERGKRGFEYPAQLSRQPSPQPSGYDRTSEPGQLG